MNGTSVIWNFDARYGDHSDEISYWQRHPPLHSKRTDSQEKLNKDDMLPIYLYLGVQENIKTILERICHVGFIESHLRSTIKNLLFSCHQTGSPKRFLTFSGPENQLCLLFTAHDRNLTSDRDAAVMGLNPAPPEPLAKPINLLVSCHQEGTVTIPWAIQYTENKHIARTTLSTFLQ
jgi:hypothetical protein